MIVVAAIPAFNEAETVGGVVVACIASPLVTHVIVVDDGSTDATAEVARAAGAEVITQTNSGKARALDVAVAEARSDLFLMLDADLIDLRPAHVDSLVQPVVDGDCDVTIGTVGRGSPENRLPWNPLSGQRCFPTRLWSTMRAFYPQIATMRFGIELGLNHITNQLRLCRKIVPMRGVWDPYKRSKYGVVLGALRRAQMWSEIARAKQYLERSPMAKTPLDRSVLGLPRAAGNTKQRGRLCTAR